MDYEVRIIALRRSGCHAIANWIAAQAPKPVRYFNDIGKALDTDSLNQLGPSDLKLPQVAYPAETYSTVIIGYENQQIPTVAKWSADSPFNPAHTFNLVILRDPFNQWASTLRMWPDAQCKSFVASWLMYAAEFTGTTHLLKNVVPVAYNLWYSSADYRNDIIKKLGLTIVDSGSLEEVPFFGPGSSFDGTCFDGRGSMMAVLDRWKTLDPIQLIPLITNTQLMRFTRSLYPDITRDVVDHVIGYMPKLEQQLTKIRAGLT